MHLARYRQYIKANLEEKPLCHPDAERFSQMHSWYKHLSPIGNVFYAYLQRGEQPRYSFDLAYESKDQYQFHWHFVSAEECSNTEIQIDDNLLLTRFSDDITVFFARFPIVLNNNFGCGPLDHVNRYEEMERITSQIWHHLTQDTAISPQPMKIRQRKPRENTWGKRLLQYVKGHCPQAYKERDHQSIMTFIDKHQIPDIDVDIIVKIAKRNWDYYSIMGILHSQTADALTNAIEQKRVGVIDIIEAFGDEGMVSDGARKMMQKIMGESANTFTYMSICDFGDDD